jgi:hypothetical protein
MLWLQNVQRKGIIPNGLMLVLVFTLFSFATFYYKYMIFIPLPTRLSSSG